ncbi:MAG: hypothetical protein LKJ80_00130 [Oscillibacter sp.]|jgi:protein-S-isoprenylcysteine O-methyltransferase Ste14|nr:hypothetical protein [Oscillibacter sp.]
MEILWGCAAFGLFFLGDLNDWKWAWAPLRICFPAGAVLLAVATVRMALNGRAQLPGALRGLFFVLAAGFLALLVYTLFFALNAGEAYVSQDVRRAVCATGIYALCRHPGVLWLAGVYLCLWAAAGVPLRAGAVFSGLNLLLVCFEDFKVFPARLAGYGAYRENTPFLIPTGRSIRACRATF